MVYSLILANKRTDGRTDGRTDVRTKVFPVYDTLFLFLINEQRDAQIPFYVFIFIYNSLHVSSISCSSSGETNCINTTSGNCHSVSVAVSCAGCTRHGHRQLPEVVLIQFVSPDDEHDMLETCREL